MARTVIGPEAIEENTLEDADGDTKVQVEETSDEDKIRFDTAGSERMIIDDSGNVGVGTSSPISKLDVAGKITISSETSTPAQPANGKGYLYTKSDGKIYWRSYDVSETDLTAGGSSGISHDGSTADGVLTYKDSDEATVESNLTFNGNTLTVTGDVSGAYVAVIDNDENSSGHGLKVTSDGSGTGTNIFDVESGSTTVFRVRADGKVAIGETAEGGIPTQVEALTVNGDLSFRDYLKRRGDSDTYIGMPANDQMALVAGGVTFVSIVENDSQDIITINDGGADVDFVVESPNESKALYLHAGNEVFHINHGESDFQTKIHNTNDLAFTVNSAGVILNDDSHATNDFRVESDSNTHMLFVDAGSDKIGINDSGPISELSVAGKISITSESSTPSAPADGHGWLYTKSDGKIYWQSNDVSETDLTAGGSSGDITAVTAGVGLSGGATSGAATLTVDFSEFSDVTPVNGDKLATLDSDGSTEQLTTIASLATLFAGTASSTGLSASSSVLSVSDLHPVGVDGSANQLMTDDADGTMTSESKALVDGAKLTIGNGTAEDTLLVFDGSAADFRIGIDDDSDTLEIGAGAAHDTTAAIIVDSSGHVTKIGQDSPSSDQVLTWDGSKAVWSAASGGGSSKIYIETFQQLKTQGSGVSISSYTSNIQNELLTIGGYGFQQVKDYIMTSADGSTWTVWDNTSTSDLGQHYLRNQVSGDTGYSSGAYGDDGYWHSKVMATAHIVPMTGTITKIWLKGMQLDGKEIRMRAWLSQTGITNSANEGSGMVMGDSASSSYFIFKELNDGEGSPTFWNGIQIGGDDTKDYFQEYETLSGYDVTVGQKLLVTFDAIGDEDNRVYWYGIHYMFEITSS
jgi:ribosomal protein L24E